MKDVEETPPGTNRQKLIATQAEEALNPKP